MKDAPLLEDDIVVGNRFDKHGSGNPVVRRLMEGFDRGMFDMLGSIGPVKSVLEVGCGEGHVTDKLARFFPGARVLGTDFSTAIIDIARREHPDRDFQVCSVYDAAALGPWDLVVACEVFEHLDDPARALEVVSKIATGHVLITVPREPLWRALNMLRGQYWSAWGNTDGHVQHWSRGSMVRFVSSRFDVAQTRTPLPWTQVLGRARGSERR
ncbi:MAG: class I SAM-dependent methyltransferase [Candidatus Eisenbacteria bacterium]|nr:class I SAM-dependent methyltransferase [Candidatus Eisenbacteria bacterium]